MDDCIFCRIASGSIKAEIICEDDLTTAFLDICPIRTGHVQIIPRNHHAYFDDLPPETASRIVHVGQRISRVLKSLYGVERVAFLFTGGDVAHAHAHVVPMHENTDITSRQYIAERELTFRSTPRASLSELGKTAEEIRLLLQ